MSYFWLFALSLLDHADSLWAVEPGEDNRVETNGIQKSFLWITDEIY